MSLHQTEGQFQDAVVQLARTLGWRVVHFRPARTGQGGHVTPAAYDAVGFVDLVLVHPTHGVLFREIKAPAGRVNHEQQRWLRLLDEAGADVAVWRPDDWPQIEETLHATC